MPEIVVIEEIGKEDDQLVWVPQAIEVELGDDFEVNDTDLSAELCRLGPLMLKYGELSAKLRAQQKRKEEQLKTEEARCSHALRQAAQANNEKTTEAKLAEQVRINPNVQNLLHQLDMSRNDAMRADHWWRSMAKKADLVQSLVYQSRAEIKSY